MPNSSFISKLLKSLKKVFYLNIKGFYKGHDYIGKSEIRIIKKMVGVKSEVESEKLEVSFSSLIGPGNSVSFASARMGFYALLKSLDIGGGDKVILCGFTCSVMVNSIIRSGATPIFSDIDPITLGSSAKSIEENLSSSVKLVVVQHSFGIPCDIGPIYELCSKYKIAILEDCALSLGSTINNKQVGTFGIASMFSFDHSKPINSVIGGIIYSENLKLYNTIKTIQKKSDHLPIDKQNSIWMQFIIERMLARKYFYGLMHMVNAIFNIFRSLARETNSVTPFLDEDTGAKVDKNMTYPYPSKIPEFIAFISTKELNQWDETLNNKRETLDIYLNKLEDNKIKEYIPDVYFYNDRVIVPLRFVLIIPMAKKVKFKLRYLVDVDNTLFTSPIVNRSDPINEYGYTVGSCPTAEKISKSIVNIPIVDKGDAEGFIRKIITILDKVLHE